MDYVSWSLWLTPIIMFPSGTILRVLWDYCINKCHPDIDFDWMNLKYCLIVIIQLVGILLHSNTITWALSVNNNLHENLLLISPSGYFWFSRSKEMPFVLSLYYWDFQLKNLRLMMCQVIKQFFENCQTRDLLMTTKVFEQCAMIPGYVSTPSISEFGFKYNV